MGLLCEIRRKRETQGFHYQFNQKMMGREWKANNITEEKVGIWDCYLLPGMELPRLGSINKITKDKRSPQITNCEKGKKQLLRTNLYLLTQDYWTFGCINRLLWLAVGTSKFLKIIISEIMGLCILYRFYTCWH